MGVSKPNLAGRVARAAEIALADHRYVTFIDVVTGLRWLHSRHVDLWRQGRAATLEDLAAVDGDRLLTTAALLRDWAQGKGLRPVTAPYVSGSRDRRPLRFTRHPEQEPFTVHWLSPDLSEARVRGFEAVADDKAGRDAAAAGAAVPEVLRPPGLAVQAIRKVLERAVRP